jgi:hypothetical protein
MTNNDIDKRIATIEQMLFQFVEEQKKPSMIRKCYNWIKPYLVPFILGMMIGGITVSLPSMFRPSSAIDQAVSGGTAIPFPSDALSPSLSTLPPRDSTEESTPSWWMNSYEPPLLDSPPADNGQTNSIESFNMPGHPKP